jgi:carbonic anhydrase
MRKFMVSAVVYALFATSVVASEAHTTHWGYLGESSPVHWGEFDAKFATCKDGKMQSPINIIPTKDENLAPLDINYTSKAKSIINNGHSIQVNIEDGSTLKVDGKVYKLKQFHFHVPSENNIKGDVFPLEAHFVHVSDDGKIAVIGVMFKEGEENPTLKKIWANLDKLKVGEAIECKADIADIKSLLPQKSQYYSFKGSLTTPPCTEGVNWFVYKDPLSVSKEQVNSFFSQFGFPNNRPVQPVNGREILE